ncbi:hypothetical protein K4L44_04230 [Halosquirtibacter laminarini]|uniref:Uncharacterized protein n=1 Tax=Halosquirtibacter laminarini TaxID=3374600 RepID=A0AC61NQ21_9BACT|nr:hypothetical protein K4L44_04230 [Prolixibacteraceae bacterium]
MIRLLPKTIFVLFILLSGVSFGQKPTKTLVYVMDPVCVWCYGNIKTINQIQKKVEGKIPMVAYCGGMWLDDEVPNGGVEFYKLLKKHNPGVVIKTKERFSPEYYRSLMDSTYRFSSYEPSKALWIIKNIHPNKFWDFKENVQRGIFEKAMRTDSFDGYLQIIDEMGLDHNAFSEMWNSKDVDAQVRSEFKISASYSSSYPTLILVEGDKREIIGKGYFYADKVLEKLGL